MTLRSAPYAQAGAERVFQLGIVITVGTRAGVPPGTAHRTSRVCPPGDLRGYAAVKAAGSAVIP